MSNVIDIDAANKSAVERMIAARPILTGVGTARDVIPGIRENLLLHAGPPIEWARMSGPLRGAIIGALILEGLADSEATAIAMVEAGEIDFAPCHHHDTVGPMAGVTSYSAYSEDVLGKLRWMNEEMGPLLADSLSSSEGIDIRALLSEALHMGDEGHNRNKAGSLLFLKQLAPLISRVSADDDLKSQVLQFLGDNALSVLNPVMAACKSMADAAHGVDHSTVVTAMARNGTDFGIRISGLKDSWFTAAAGIPDGLYQ